MAAVRLQGLQGQGQEDAHAREVHRRDGSQLGRLRACGRVQSATVETDKGSRIYFAEPFLEGTFTRYSYNTGYWEEEKLDPWLLRFALWTYQVTSGFLMVADLQGIRTSAGYELTDPVILCTDLNRFGNTNLGPEMMERCKQSAEKHLADLEGRGVTTSAVDIS
jgi:hypothetical protein